MCSILCSIAHLAEIIYYDVGIVYLILFDTFF